MDHRNICYIPNVIVGHGHGRTRLLVCQKVTFSGFVQPEPRTPLSSVTVSPLRSVRLCFAVTATEIQYKTRGYGLTATRQRGEIITPMNALLQLRAICELP